MVGVKLAKYVRFYVITSQGIFLMAMLGVGGYFLGRYLIKDNYYLAAILAVLGIFTGLVVFIKLILNYGGDHNRKTI